jgi:hypothetical protein
VQVVPNLKAPVVLFTYYNPILKRGPEVFMKAVKAAGASGMFLPSSNSFLLFRVQTTPTFLMHLRIREYINTGV